MVYVVFLSIVITILANRNPALILTRVSFRMPYLFIGCLALQLLLAVISPSSQILTAVLLALTFVGLIIGLYMNKNLKGIPLLLAGTALNTLAILLHGGSMPVSEAAIHAAHLEAYMDFSNDTRHHLMQPSLFWWLGDWIPLIVPFAKNYILSPGDAVNAAGLAIFIYTNSPKRG